MKRERWFKVYQKIYNCVKVCCDNSAITANIVHYIWRCMVRQW